MSQKSMERKKRRILSQLHQINEMVQETGDDLLSDWEIEFIESLIERLDTYETAFSDAGKGHRNEPLSALQSQKLKEILATIRKPKTLATDVKDSTTEEDMKSQNTCAPKLRVISNPTPPNGEPQAYIPRCARPVQGRSPRLVSVK